jgi:cation transport ATPase
VGGWGFVEELAAARGAPPLERMPGEGLRAYVTVNGQGAGVVEYADAVRQTAASLIERLRGLGIQKMVLLSGDSADNADAVAREVGVDDARATCFRRTRWKRSGRSPPPANGS